MAEQDVWRLIEAQPMPSLLVPPGMRTYHRGLPNIVEPFRATGQGGEAVTTSISTQRTRGPARDRGSGERSEERRVGKECA